MDSNYTKEERLAIDKELCAGFLKTFITVRQVNKNGAVVMVQQ